MQFNSFPRKVGSKSCTILTTLQNSIRPVQKLTINANDYNVHQTINR